MQHYFALNVNDKQIFLEEGDVFHITKVMRMRTLDKIRAIYNEKLYEGLIISLNPLVVKNNGEILEDSRELNVNTTLFFALAKGDKIDFVVQKATELGVSRIVLIKTEHSIVKMDNDDFNRKLPRYRKIAKEASEQSERRKIPEILGVYDINNLPTSLLADINLVAYEVDAFKKVDFDQINDHQSVSILIGPEGGLTVKEIVNLSKQGFKRVSLGKRILRTETAALTALSMINMVVER